MTTGSYRQEDNKSRSTGVTEATLYASAWEVRPARLGKRHQESKKDAIDEVGRHGEQ